MQKLPISNIPNLEKKINEIIDEIHDLQGIIEQQNTIMSKQLEIIKQQKIELAETHLYIREMKKQLPDILRQAVEEQSVSVFQDWLKE